MIEKYSERELEACSWIRRTDIVKMAHPIENNLQIEWNPKQKSQLCSPQKKKEKASLKFICKHKRPHIAKQLLMKKNIAEGNILTYYKQYYRAIVIKSAWYGTKIDS